MIKFSSLSPCLPCLISTPRFKIGRPPSRISHYDLQTLSINLEDVLQIWQLASHHKDPFDRLLIAQSQTNNLPIITADNKFSLYDVSIIW